MKERILQLLEMEQMSPSRFADLIGVQRSSVSHILSGRNKPSFDFLEKTLRAFPGLKADWLILGEGPMYERMGRDEPGDLFGETESGGNPFQPPSGSAADPDKSVDSSENSTVLEEESGIQAQIGDEDNRGIGVSDGADSVKKRTVIQVLIFYDDHTFQSFGPAQ